MQVIRDGHRLRLHDRQFLVHPITHGEIDLALKDIGDLKAPGIDGYNAFFFKRAWNQIRNDVYAAVGDFFESATLYPALNCTLVTLIPKTPTATRVQEMRPIACCTTIYKIISKILTNRLGKVINSIVDES